MGVSLVLLMAAQAAPQPPRVPEAVLAGDPSLEQSAGGAPDPRLLHLQPAAKRLFDALNGTSSGGDNEIDRLVAAAVAELDIACPRLSDYQVYRLAPKARTLKVKCKEQPVYALTVGPSGEAFVSGGDGTIKPMRIEDAPIRTILGIPAEEYMARKRAQGGALADVDDLIAPVEGASPHRARPAFHAARLLPLLFAVPVLALVWLLLKWRGKARAAYARWQGLDSETKTRLVGEAEEIYPNLYRHPEGVFIARGRRGKRRLFPSLIFAYLYSSRGFKLFEIR